MRIGIPRELKPLEGRVGLIPAAAADKLATTATRFLSKKMPV